MATVEAPARPHMRLHEGPFVNEPLTDFTKDDNARKMRAAIDKVRGQLGREYDLIIGGKRVKTSDKIVHQSGQAVAGGRHPPEGRQGTRRARHAGGAEAFESWSRTSFEERASLLFRVADIMRERKFEFYAWLVFEVGKNWAEADADIAETIDFCEFYAREALRLSRTERRCSCPASTTSVYIPLGVGAVIPPWNFPCAIMAGMTLASIVSGNTVILKPSSDSPTIAAKFFELLEEADARRRGEFLPRRRRQLRQRAGGASQDALHRLHRIARSGPRHQQSAATRPRTDLDQAHHPRNGRQGRHRRRRRRRLDSAVEGVAQAAFGYQGQKCSACSRAIVDERIYDKFLEKLKARVEKITVGDPAENANMGAVINEGSMKSILDYIEVGKKDGRVITGGGAPNAGEGYFMQPTVIADIPRGRSWSRKKFLARCWP